MLLILFYSLITALYTSHMVVGTGLDRIDRSSGSYVFIPARAINTRYMSCHGHAGFTEAAHMGEDRGLVGLARGWEFRTAREGFNGLLKTGMGCSEYRRVGFDRPAITRHPRICVGRMGFPRRGLGSGELRSWQRSRVSRSRVPFAHSAQLPG